MKPGFLGIAVRRAVSDPSRVFDRAAVPDFGADILGDIRSDRLCSATVFDGILVLSLLQGL